MEFIEFFAGIDDENRRFDKVIRKMTEKSNISSLYSAIRKGLIKLNDKKCDPSTKISNGDKISIAKFLIESNKIEILSNENNKLNISSEKKLNKTSINLNKLYDKLEIIFENEFVKIINKPYNINVHGSQEECSLTKIIEEKYKSLHKTSLSFVPGPLHRLDKKTTGLIVFSNNLIGANVFSKLISEKKVRKFYLGICQGRIENQQTWNNTIEKNQNNKSNFFTMKINSAIKSINQNQLNYATTICTPLSYGKYKNNEITLCQYEIITGKKHQIRLQSSFHGHPLLGDTAYNGIKINEKQDFFLHAYKLITEENNQINLPKEITASIPQNYKDFLNQTLINYDGRLII